MPQSASHVVTLAADIVAAFVSSNSLPKSDLPALIESVHVALMNAAAGVDTSKAAVPEPAVPLRKSLTVEYVVCLEDGKKFRSLKRHLGQHGLTPEGYRAKWGLPANYPMVAPAYATRRSELARKSGLGHRSKPGA